MCIPKMEVPLPESSMAFYLTNLINDSNIDPMQSFSITVCSLHVIVLREYVCVYKSNLGILMYISKVKVMFIL